MSNGDRAAGLIKILVPEVRIVALSTVLDRRPEWADAFARKDPLESLPHTLRDSRWA